MRKVETWNTSKNYIPEFQLNIEKNFHRLLQPPYDFESLFEGNPGWPGDREGRALLAFLCHYHISGRRIPCMGYMRKEFPEKTNQYLFFGAVPEEGQADEQQLSGHNWYLRGLVEFYRTFRDPMALTALRNTFEHLYLPALPLYDCYPLDRKADGSGGVDGHISSQTNGWALSSDVGCAFMCVDGLSQYYDLTGDSRARDFLDHVIDLFLEADMVKRGFQTHTSLTCLRGILTMYENTQNRKYLTAVIKEFDRYQQYGMTLTYENYNWFGRPETWTEPCAVVDSLLLAVHLYEITSLDKYRILARRIWINGLQFCQRDNGGAGTNTCVTTENRVLKVSDYEASQCCTMRYAEALLCYHKNRKLFTYDALAPVITEPDGRRYIDDRLLVVSDGEIKPIFSCNTIPREQLPKIELYI